uniref:Uncharacterized protein n=1 Tax=Steinernema glaseri TaxID=37863 RepID=A0A1I7YQX0_9BILA
MDDISCDNKGLTLMRVGTDDLSIDMSPASLDDTSEPAYRHELVVSAPSSSTAPPPQEAHPPRLFPEVPPLLSPPVSNEHYEPVETNTAKAPKAPPPKSPVAINALKIRNMASGTWRAIYKATVSDQYSGTVVDTRRRKSSV